MALRSISRLSTQLQRQLTTQRTSQLTRKLTSRRTFTTISRRMADQKSEAGKAISEVSKQTGGTYKGTFSPLHLSQTLL